MTRYDDMIHDNYGRPVPGAYVYVYDDAGALVPLADDADQPLDNPLVTDEFGAFYFNASDGEKVLDIWFGGRRRWKTEILVGPLPKGDPGSPGEGYATRGAMAAAAPAPTNLDDAYLTEPGREGKFVFRTGNHAALVATDTRQGIYVAPVADPTGGSGAWVRQFDGPVNVRWFGAAADFVTDDLPAFDGALATIRARMLGGFPGGDKLYIPAGRYYLSDTWNIHAQVIIEGAGSAQTNGAATLIRFGKNCNGIVFNYNTTHGDGLGAQGTSEGASLRGVQLWGGNVNVDGNGNILTFGAGDSTVGHGVRIRASFVAAEDVMCAFFGGSGFNINATAGSGAYTNGNANSFHLKRCQAIYNRGYGFEIAGSDANAGTTDTCSAVQNAGAGFMEYSFLGNTHLAAHARDNGNTDPAGNNAPVGTCVHNGLQWYVRADRVAQASAQEPGTGDAWVQKWNVGATRNWTAGQTWVVPGAYNTNPANVNGRNVFIGCYAESAQAPNQATYPSIFIGGLLDEVGFSPLSTAAWQRGSARGGIVAGDFHAQNLPNTVRTRFGGGNASSPDNATILRHEEGVLNAELQSADFYGGTVLQWLLANTFKASVLALDDDSPYGAGSTAISRLFVGHAIIGIDSARAIAYINAVAELNGRNLMAGSRYYYINPAIAGAEGVVVTTAGIAGAGAVLTEFGRVAAQQAAVADAAGGATVDTEARAALNALLARLRSYGIIAP